MISVTTIQMRNATYVAQSHFGVAGGDHGWLSGSNRRFSAWRRRWRLSRGGRVSFPLQLQFRTHLSSCSPASADAIWMASLSNSNLWLGGIGARFARAFPKVIFAGGQLGTLGARDRVQNYSRNLSSSRRPFGIRVQHAKVGDGMVSVIGGQRRRSNIAYIRIETPG